MDTDRNTTPLKQHQATGQALTEYALILALVALALAAAFIATGSVIDDVFSRAVSSADNINDPINRNQIEGFQQTLEWLEARGDATRVPDELNPPLVATPLPEDVTEEPPPPVETTPVPIELTPTLVPSETPADESFNLTFSDTANDTADWYRLEGNAYIGLQATTARFFQDEAGNSLDIKNLKEVRSYYQDTGEPDPVHEQQLIAPGEDVPGVSEQNFSAQFRREIWITQDETLTFTINSRGGGVRVYYTDGGSCSNFQNTITPLGGVARDSGDNGSSCMLIDEWVNTPNTDNLTATRTFNFSSGISPQGSPGPNPGPEDGPFAGFVIWVEFYNAGQSAVPQLNFTIDTPRQNLDDTGLNGAIVQCNWGQYEGERSNVRPFAWYSAVGLDDFPDNQRCHLELRGSIEIDPDTELNGTTPTFSFWHIWDLNPNTSVKLQMANYTAGVGPGAWVDVWAPTLEGTRNYEWTQEELVLDGSNGISTNAGDEITYRFVIENNNGGGGRKRWYVDDIRLGSRNLPDLSLASSLTGSDTFGICDNINPGNGAVCASYWDFNDAGDMDDFRMTGRWARTSTGARSGQGLGDDPGNSYSLEEGADLGATPLDRRIYWVEFDKPIDVSDTTTNGTEFVVSANAPVDTDGDRGAPMLTFWHSYNIKDNVALQVQYYDETNDRWELLREVIQTNSGAEVASASTFVQIPLNEREVADANGMGTGEFDTYTTATAGSTVWTDWANGPIRVRFSMIILEDAIANATNGWTLDEIQIERLGVFEYLPYPLDQTGNPSISELQDTWQRTGTWAFSQEGSRDGQYVLSDSPGSNYLASTNTFTETRAIIDLNSDTPENIYGRACTANCLTPDGNPTSNPAVDGHAPADDPRITFWWRRGLASPARLSVEVRPNAGAGTPVTAWEYNYDSSNATQVVWERTEIDLDPFINDEADIGNSNVYDDDIIITFRLTTGNTQADGVYIDEFLLADAPAGRSFQLWDDDDLPDGENGDGRTYIDTVDSRTSLGSEDNCNSESEDNCDDTGGKWFERWHYGGRWFSGFYEYTYLDKDGNEQVDLIARSGTQVFHESPPTSDNPLNSNPNDDDNYFYPNRSFSVLEMIRTIDMTGLETERATGDPVGIATAGDNGNPIMYWWQRYDRGQNAKLLVQVATRQSTSANEYRNSNPLSYGNDELYGWSSWQTIYYDNGDDENYAWTRQAVNLARAPIYNASGNPIDNDANFVGEEIRVRFVLDALDVTGNQARDGWFIDDIEFTVQVPTITDFNNDPELTIWEMEGTWGADPNLYQGGTSIANFPGSNWNVNWVNCNYRPNVSSGTQTNSDRGCNASKDVDSMLTESDYRSLYGTLNAGQRWYINETLLPGLPFEYSLPDKSNEEGRPPNAPGGFVWHDNFGAEFQRTIEVAQADVYDIYVRSDDGVRVGITNLPTTSELRGAGGSANTQFHENVPADGGGLANTYVDNAINGTDPIYYANVINQWKNQSATVYTRSVGLVTEPDGATPREYILTVQYYEASGEAEIVFGMTTGEFSLTDSPVEIPVENIRRDYIPANYLSNTSIVYDGLIDLRAANKPVLRYFTYYKLNNINATAYLEVSDDGGFSWTESNLQGNVTTSDGATSSATSRTNWGGDTNDWVERLNTLESYRGELISLRFRLDVGADMGEMKNQENNNRGDGLYIDDVLVFDLEPDTPAPQIVINPPVSVFVSEGGKPQQLSVIANGTQPLKYEWYKGQQPADPDTVPANAELIEGATSPNYTPPTDLESGLHIYWVRVSNSVSDSDASIKPAQSVPTEYRVLDCLPVAAGDCNIYRINVNGNDVDTADSTQPGWSGDLESASAYVPTGNSFGGQDVNINMPSTSDNEFVQAAIIGAAPESLYRTYRATTDTMNWEFPVGAGQYTIRLYMADPNDSNRDQGAFTVYVNGNVADYVVGGATSPLSNVNFYNLIERANQTPAVVQLAPVNITNADSSIELTIENNNRTTFVSGIEIFPITDIDPVITDEPNDTIAGADGQATVRVSATGANLSFQWYVDGSPIVNDGTTYEIINDVSDLSGASTLILKGLNNPPAPQAPVNVYVEVTGGDEPFTTLTSRTALVGESCAFDVNTPGSCDRWYLNVGDNAGDGTIDATDNGEAIKWTPSVTPYGDGVPGYEAQTFSGGFLQNDDFEAPGTWGYNFRVVESFIPRSVFGSYVQSNSPSGINFELPVTSGSYDATFFFAYNSDTLIDITIEGTLEENDFVPFFECGNNQYCSVTVSAIPVTDGAVSINVKRDNAVLVPARLNALSVTRN
jgi:Flp pilus assembly pilin Flp